jgi:hypothetical protein
MIVEPSSSYPAVTGAIRQAARLTGADFQYLLATAQVESNLNPNAKGATSSARGLFQFIDQTWLAVLKQHGPALGYDSYAGAIERRPSGEYAVADPRWQGPIMRLRSDPSANAAMAGAFTRGNAAALSERLGRDASEGELYIAHFLGSAGAGRLIGLAASKPQASAAAAFPSAARANRGVFYDPSGRARGAAEVYRLLVGRYDTARASATTRTAFLPDIARLAEPVQAVAQESAPPATDESRPVFHGLFSSAPRREPVAPVVTALWSAPRPAAPSQVAAPTQQARGPVQNSGGPLDLFQDHVPDARALFRGRV